MSRVMVGIVAATLAIGTTASARAGDAKRGEALFATHCSRCHAISPDVPDKRGPYLAGLFDRAPGAVANFPYRMVFKEAGPVWTEAELNNYLEIHLLPKSVDRADVIAYLKRATAK